MTNRSARRDAASFGGILLVLVTLCALVTGDGGIYWTLLGLVPVYLVAQALDQR